MKKLVSVLPILMSFLLLWTSCDKEFSYETPPVSDGTLRSATSGACLSSVVNGIYKATTPLSTTNYMDVQVDVTATGSYTISTNIVNGISFTATGEFTATGINTVRLQGKGTPLASGTHIFKITYLASSCNIPVVTMDVNAAEAAYTYTTAADGSCSGAVLNGVYTMATAVGAGNTVQLAVNVATAGIYNITTATVNGIHFSATGSFTSTGVQTVLLKASGTPVASGGFNFTVTKGSNSCTFSVNIIPTGVVAGVYTLGGAGSNCTGVTLAGIYTSGTALTSANTAKIQVTVTTLGTYTISTATVNGVSFAGSGTFTTTGTQLVTLTATGKPTTSGTSTFTVTAGTATCNFDVPFAAPAAPAVFILTGAPGACTTPVVNGTYQALTPLTAANTVAIQVNVTSVGTFSISTNTVSGIHFSAAGMFTSTGNTTVTLLGTGTPSAAGTITLTPAVNGAGCNFDVPVTPAPAGIFNCKIDGVYTSFDNRAAAEVFNSFTGVPVPYLYLNGYTADPNGNFVPQFQIFIEKNDNSPVNTGTYDENHFVPPGTYRIEIDLHLENPDQSVTIWNTSSNFLPPAHPPFTIKITSRTSSRITGTFSGKVTNTLQGSTVNKTITEGVFDLPIQ